MMTRTRWFVFLGGVRFIVSSNEKKNYFRELAIWLDKKEDESYITGIL